jgi:hypothetical protein
MKIALRRTELAVLVPVAAPQQSGVVLPLPKRRAMRRVQLKPVLEKLAATVLPPLAVLTLFLLIWQIAALVPAFRRQHKCSLTAAT